MFDNLVESSSHKDDISRKGSFIGITALIYGVLMVAFFVAGIFWYDAHLGEMELELTTLVAPVPVPQQQKEPEQKQEAKPTKVEQNVDVRKELIADVTRTSWCQKNFGQSQRCASGPTWRNDVRWQQRLERAAPMPAGPGVRHCRVRARPKFKSPTNHRHPRPSQPHRALPFPAACSTAKPSAYPSQRIHQSPGQHMLRARLWCRC